MEKISMGQRLQQRFGLRQDQMAQIKEMQRSQGIGLLRAALELGIVSGAEYVRFATAEYKLPAVQAYDLRIPEEMQQLLPLDVYHKYKYIPFQRKGQCLYLFASGSGYHPGGRNQGCGDSPNSGQSSLDRASGPVYPAHQ